MSFLGRITYLLRALPALPLSYASLLYTFLTHAIASIIKAAFFFVPFPTSRVPEDKQPVMVAEEAVEDTTAAAAETAEVEAVTEAAAEGDLDSMVTSVEDLTEEVDTEDTSLPSLNPWTGGSQESLTASTGGPDSLSPWTGGQDSLPPSAVFSLTGGRVPLALVPRHSQQQWRPTEASQAEPQVFSSLSHTFTTSSPKAASSPLETLSPRDPSSIVDLYCDDEFKLSLEYQPNMVLYPVEGIHSMEGYLSLVEEGSILSMSLPDSNSMSLETSLDISHLETSMA